MAIKHFSVSRITRMVSAGAVLAGAYLMQPYRPVIFMGTSMTPTYENHEFALATTDTSRLKRGDVVVLDTDRGTIVKRIAHLSGDTIERYYEGGEWSDACGTVGTASQRIRKKLRVMKTRVPDGFVYVLGDNPMVSQDSRQLGVFPISSVRCVLVDPKPQKPMTTADFHPEAE